MSEIETWKSVEDFEDYYEVSNFGYVKSLPRFRNTATGGYTSKERILARNKTGKYGLLQVRLTCGDTGFQCTAVVARLVAQAFLGLEYDNHLDVVTHIDGDQGNNHVDNLKIYTQQEKTSVMKGKGKLYNPSQHNKLRQITQLDMNGNILNIFPSIKEASKYVGATYSDLINCLSKRILKTKYISQNGEEIIYTHIAKTVKGFKWKYYERTTNTKEDNGLPN